MASAARWCFAAAICALLGTALLLSGGDLASTSVLLRGALHGGASQAAEGGATGLASEKLRRLEDAEVDVEKDFLKKPAKERLLSEEPPLRRLTLGSCQGCTSNEVQISEELFLCVADFNGGCMLKEFCRDDGPNTETPCCQKLCEEEHKADWNCPNLKTTICPRLPDPDPSLQGNPLAISLPRPLLQCIADKRGPCHLLQECKRRWTGELKSGDDEQNPYCCQLVEEVHPKWECDFNTMDLTGFKGS